MGELPHANGGQVAHRVVRGISRCECVRIPAKDGELGTGRPPMTDQDTLTGAAARAMPATRPVWATGPARRFPRSAAGGLRWADRHPASDELPGRRPGPQANAETGPRTARGLFGQLNE